MLLGSSILAAEGPFDEVEAGGEKHCADGEAGRYHVGSRGDIHRTVSVSNALN